MNLGYFRNEREENRLSKKDFEIQENPLKKILFDTDRSKWKTGAEAETKENKKPCCNKKKAHTSSTRTTTRTTTRGGTKTGTTTTRGGAKTGTPIRGANPYRGNITKKPKTLTPKANKTDIYILRGGVVDEKGKPMEGANVVNLDRSKGAVVSNTGIYSIECKANDLIQISFVGFKTIKVPAAKMPTTVIMHEEDEVLDEIIVTNAKPKKNTFTGNNGGGNIKDEASITSFLTNYSAVLFGVLGLGILYFLNKRKNG